MDKNLAPLVEECLTAFLEVEEEVVFDFGEMPKPSSAMTLYARAFERGSSRRKADERNDLLRREAEAISIALGTNTENLEPALVPGSYEDQMYRGYGIGDIFDPMSFCYDPGEVDEEFEKEFN
jgi:hypothetical protein